MCIKYALAMVIVAVNVYGSDLDQCALLIAGDYDCNDSRLTIQEMMGCVADFVDICVDEQIDTGLCNVPESYVKEFIMVNGNEAQTNDYEQFLICCSQMFMHNCYMDLLKPIVQ
ncbi:unnamed protein product [Oppiella nova]|uniref:Venom protein n=1 Tax=Oppiella nova TaxID=334625 RepID=A0A7R9QQ13_9ACAR|nr:unnamed protein product [Oppiella nova]CAG2171410.1 unnamed protein product [Oppiella nova]